MTRMRRLGPTVQGATSHPPSKALLAVPGLSRRLLTAMNPLTTQHVVDFRTPRDLTELSRCIGIQFELFNRIVTDAQRARFYLKHDIPKRNSHRADERRTVWECGTQQLADAHKAFARRFDIFARDCRVGYPHAAAFGYLRGRSIKDNARIHCGARLLLRADITDFFPSITATRLISLFLTLGLNSTVADLLARFTTIEGRLPLGIHVSPLLSNLICLSLDDKLETLAAAHHCRYTRYADDMCFSSDSNVPPYSDVAQILESESFSISMRKVRKTKRGQAHFVTGLSISDATAPHVPRRFKRRLRQELYYCEQFGIRDHLGRIGESCFRRGVNRLDGTVRYVAGIETSLASELQMRWEKLLSRDHLRPSYAPRQERPVRKITFLVDEAEIQRGAHTILALALVATEELETISSATESLLRDYQADPFASGRKGRLEAKGLHFTDAHEELKSEYIKALPSLPFRAYVSYAKLIEPSEYNVVYCRLLSSLLKHRLMGCDRAEVTIVIEGNQKVSVGSLEVLLAKTYAELEEANQRRPLASPSMTIVGKREQPSLSVPDFLLGLFADYASREYSQQKGGPTESVRNRFERLRDKFRLIVDVDTNSYYSRKRPFNSWPPATG